MLTNTGLAYLYIPTTAENELVGQLAAKTEMPVQQAEANKELQPNHIYVIAPDRPMIVSDGMVKSMVSMPDYSYATVPTTI